MHFQSLLLHRVVENWTIDNAHCTTHEYMCLITRVSLDFDIKTKFVIMHKRQINFQNVNKKPIHLRYFNFVCKTHKQVVIQRKILILLKGHIYKQFHHVTFVLVRSKANFMFQ